MRGVEKKRGTETENSWLRIEREWGSKEKNVSLNGICANFVNGIYQLKEAKKCPLIYLSIDSCNEL